MRTILSVVIIIVAAVTGFAMGADMNKAIGVQLYLQQLQVSRVRFKLLRVRKSRDALSSHVWLAGATVGIGKFLHV